MTKKKVKQERKIYKVSQKIFLYNPEDKKFLLVKAADTGGEFFTKYGPWDVIGGHIDEGDNPEEALHREITEEAGDKLMYRIDSVFDHIEMKYGSYDRLAVGVLAFYEGGEIELSDEHTEYRWFTASEIQGNPEIKNWIKDFIGKAVERLKATEYLNDLKRLQADFDNYKKRQAEAEKSLKGYLIESLVLDLIPVLDNFHQATMHVPDDQKSSPWVVGIQYIEKQLETVLTENGVILIEPIPGEAFDPTKHEALESEVKDEEMTNTIAAVKQKGYQLGERIIRAAKVSIK